MPFGEVFIPIVLFVVFFGVFYLYITARHKERMALIESGADPNLFVRAQRMKGKRYLSWWTLKLALFLIGVSFGIIIGNILAETTLLQTEVCYFSSIMLFGGLGLMVYYLYEKSQLTGEDENLQDID